MHFTIRPASFLTTALFLLLVLSAVDVTDALAQRQCSEALTLATEEYEQGYFDRATFRLDTCLRNQAFNEEQEKEAYLLLGRIYYANLQIDQARDSVRKLLQKNPAYQLDPAQHKPGFIDLYEEVMQEVKQTPAPGSLRSGFWIGLGLAPAEGNIECSCRSGLNDDDPWNGGSAGSFNLFLGGTVSPNLQLGAELSSWQRRLDNGDDILNSQSTIGMLTFIARYYPNATGNFFLKGGLGLGSSVLERDVNARGDRSIKLEATGLGVQFGLGYDFPLGRAKKFALSPFINLSILYAEEDVQTFQFLDLANQTLESITLSGPENPSFFQLGLSFTAL